MIIIHDVNDNHSQRELKYKPDEIKMMHEKIVAIPWYLL